MLSLHPNHIIDLYVLVDDSLPLNFKSNIRGRPSILTNSELITILIWNTLMVKQKTIRDIHKWVKDYHSSEFPKLPKYSAFVDQCHKVIPLIYFILETTLATHEPLRLMDSTMLEVCKIVRADSHKVAKNIAKFGKNHQGWHYGFKLHASIDLKGKFCGLALTPADIYDAQVMPKILNENSRIAVGDSHYGASVMRRIIWERYGTIVIAPPHFSQKKKVLTWWQHILLKARPKIESVFGYLKERLNLVTSFPRSVKGYLFHYLRIILSYQLMIL